MATPAPAPALYIASTPLIALSCAAAALRNGGRAALVVIEDFDLAPRLQSLLESWRDNPFERIERFPGRYVAPGLRSDARGAAALVQRARRQRLSRRGILAALRALDAEFRPVQVWLGNDRRVETQLALDLASRRIGASAGRYLDDGLYTYLGDVREGRDRWRIDDELKRLAYGRWWTRVAHAGTSPWIAEDWLAYPALAPAAYDPGAIRRLPVDWFANRAFARLCIDAARAFALERCALRSCDAVVVMPHSEQLRAQPKFALGIRAMAARIAAEGRRIAVKHHPRETEPDPAGLIQTGTAMALPSLLPMELLLPLLPRGALLLGEITTALLAAHWLRPDLTVRDLGLASGRYAERARALFLQAGIPSLHGEIANAFAGDRGPGVAP